MNNNTKNSLIDFFLIIIVFFSSVIIYLSRLGLENNIQIILKTSGLIFFLILFPNFFNKLIFYKKQKIYFSKPIITFILLFFVIISGFLNHFFMKYLYYTYFILGFFLLFLYLFFELYNLKISKFFFFIFFFSIFFSIFITAAYYQNHYNHPLMIEKIINGSFAHRDTIYHAAIAGIFKTYNFIGTGIDGFVPHRL